MTGLDLQPPHVGRLVRRVVSRREPLVQIWGWPGSARSAVLEGLLQAEGERALGLSLEELSGETELRRRLDAPDQPRFLVATSCPEDRLRLAARWLKPGQQLVFATERRFVADDFSCAVVPPQELLLENGEVEALWHLLTGTAPPPGAARRLREVTDGWYQPLRLAIEATGGLGLGEASVRSLLQIPSLRLFLRHEVVDAWSPEERAVALEEAPDDWWLRQGPAARGLWVEDVDGERPPRLLATFLETLRQQREARAAGGRPAADGGAAATSGPADSPVFVLGLLGDPIARQRYDSEEGAEGSAEGQGRDLDWRLKRSFGLLAFLAASPGLQAGREELVEAVWPRHGERTIDRNFHPTLSHLRRALEGAHRGRIPPPLLFRGGIYRLNPEIRWEIDLLDFRRLLQEGRYRAELGEGESAVELWRQAWQLYRGPFLQGHYDPWVLSQRETYQGYYLNLLRDLGDLYLKLGRPEEALDAYRGVLIEDPLQERIHLELMRIYAGQGRRDLARRQYERLCNLLLDELGVSPMPETTTEYHRLLA